MPSEILNCPECGRELRVPEELAGKRIKCPSCLTNFTPGGAAAPEDEPRPTALPADETQAAEADGLDPAVAEAQERIDRAWRTVQFPANSLFVVGALTIFNGANLFVSGWQTLRHPQNQMVQARELLERIGFGVQAQDEAALAEHVRTTAIAYLIMGPLGSVVGIVTVCAAVRMRALRSLRLARIASILIMLPLAPPCCFLAFPFGLWCLILLARPEVSSQFE